MIHALHLNNITSHFKGKASVLHCCLCSLIVKLFLYCTPEAGNIILRSDEVDSIIVLGEPLGAYTELDIKESL